MQPRQRLPPRCSAKPTRHPAHPDVDPHAVSKRQLALRLMRVGESDVSREFPLPVSIEVGSNDITPICNVFISTQPQLTTSKITLMTLVFNRSFKSKATRNATKTLDRNTFSIGREIPVVF